MYGPDQFMNPGPAPRPPADRPRLNLMPSTLNVPGNMSQLSLQSSSIRSTSTYADSSTPSLARSTTLIENHGAGGVAIIKEGAARCKDGLLWKNRYLVLRAFQLDFQKGQDGKVSMSIQLKDVTGVSRSESNPLSFEITRVASTGANSSGMAAANRDLPQKTIICQLKSDDEIYEWIDAIYNRCPGMGGVSNPTNFSHRVHVGFDPVTGSFVGLPLEWERLLTASAITKQDYQEHPQVVLEVLQFYSDITKRSEHPETYPSLTPTPPVTTAVNKQLGHGGGGTSIAPPRPSPPGTLGSPPGFAQQPPRFAQDTPSRSQTGTPLSDPRKFSGNERSQDQNFKKMGMDQEMRLAMEEEARKIKAAKEQRELERARDEQEQARRDQEAYNASLPKSRTPLAKQEIGGYGGTPDSSSPPSRYNPTRNAPPAPHPDRTRQQPQGSLRQMPAPRQVPSNTAVNGNIAPPRAPFTQKQPSSREQSPSSAHGSLRTTQRPEQQLRQPSPSPHPTPDSNQRNLSSQSHVRANGAPTAVTNNLQPPSRLPAPVQPSGTANGTTRPPAGGSPVTNGDKHEPAKPAEVSLAAKPPAGTRQKEVRMSSMTESQVMERLKQVVSKDDPQLSYSKQKKIGQGASGSVYVARVNENAVSPVARRLYKTYGAKANVAIKQMDLRNQPRKELIVNEIIVMKESSHPNIVNFLDSFLQEGNNELWVVMEFMEGGALTDVIDNNSHITEAQISTICNEVYFPVFLHGRRLTVPKTCKGLAHLHSQNIIHRDIKSDNVLLDARGNVKISKPLFSVCNQQSSDILLLRQPTLAFVPNSRIRSLSVPPWLAPLTGWPRKSSSRRNTAPRWTCGPWGSWRLK